MANEPLATEHVALLEASHVLLDHLGSVEDRLAYGPTDTQRIAHMRWGWRARQLRTHLVGVLGLVEANAYPSAFVLLRTALEHMLVDKLLHLADRFTEPRSLPRGKTAEQWERELDVAKDDPDETLVGWRCDRPNHYALTFTGYHEGGKPSGMTISPYYFLIEHYDPFAGKPSQQGHVVQRFSDLDDLREMAKRAKWHWDEKFSFPRILDNLLVNDLLTERERLHLELHYGFLSAFTHATGAGYEQIQGRTMNVDLEPAYDHYASELTLLYLIRWAIEELHSVRRGFDRPPVVRLSGWNHVEADLERADRVSKHLWVLGTQPHRYDRVMAANDLMFKRAGARSAAILKEPQPDPALLTDEEIGFDPNPLHRLIQMHADQTEMMTRLTYRSPFPRIDARFR
jgi:hypothetical protein